jgi:hypothetical protein
VAVGAGVVVEISQENTLTGVAVSNLFKWNSVMLQLDDGDASAAASASVSSSPDDAGADVDAATAGAGEGNGGSAAVRGDVGGRGGGGGGEGGGEGGNRGEGGNGREQVGGKVGGGSSSVWGGALFVEYVHIKAGSCCVAVGERVSAGQKICESGSVGFSPEPHLHFTAFRSREPTAPTTRVRFRGGGGEGGGEGGGGGGGGGAAGAAYIPVAGQYYNVRGEQPAPPPQQA